MSDHFIEIYKQQVDLYQQMIAAEDVDGNLHRALNDITDFSDKRVLDLGSGTGRIAQILDGEWASLTSLDLHRSMLSEQQRLIALAPNKWQITQGDILQLPLATNAFDVVIAGWAIGHFCSWYANDWELQIKNALAQMLRVAAPGAQLIILETMGTGASTPAPPTSGLADYYELLDKKHNFTQQSIATDYLFDDLAQAEELIGFFFGDELAETVVEKQWLHVPEWTGVWSKGL